MKIIKVPTCQNCDITLFATNEQPCSQCFDDPTPKLEMRVKELEEYITQMDLAACHNEVLEERVRELEEFNRVLKDALEQSSPNLLLKEKVKEVEAALDVAAEMCWLPDKDNTMWWSKEEWKQWFFDEAKRRLEYKKHLEGKKLNNIVKPSIGLKGER